MPGHLEVEQKFHTDDLAAIERRAADAGASFTKPVVQTDRYYAHPARDFAQTDEALRIRRVGESNFVTYKGPKLDPQTKTRREIELALPPGEAGFSHFATLLEALGFRPVAEVRKQRRVAHLDWQGFGVEIALDDVDGVGRFVELEIAAASTDLDNAKQAVLSLAEQLDLHQSERRSYLELLLEGEARSTRSKASTKPE
jgi:adenylate cyclase class 2